MLAIADDKGLYDLEFIEHYGVEVGIEAFKKKIENSNVVVDENIVTRQIEAEIEVLRKKAGNLVIILGKNVITRQVEAELEDYFLGNNLKFTTSIYLIASPPTCVSRSDPLFDGPAGIALNAAGTEAFVTNKTNNKVIRCTVGTDGAFSACTDMAATNLSSPVGIALAFV